MSWNPQSPAVERFMAKLDAHRGIDRQMGAWYRKRAFMASTVKFGAYNDSGVEWDRLFDKLYTPDTYKEGIRYL